MQGRISPPGNREISRWALPNYKIFKLQIVLTPNVWPGNVNVSGMPCFRCYLIPPVPLIRCPRSLHWLPITRGCHSAAHARHVKLCLYLYTCIVTAGLDFLSAWNMVEDAKQQLGSVEIDDILKKTLNFITNCNEIVVNSDNDAFTIEIESDFRPETHARWKGEGFQTARSNNQIPCWSLWFSYWSDYEQPERALYRQPSNNSGRILPWSTAV